MRKLFIMKKKLHAMPHLQFLTLADVGTSSKGIVFLSPCLMPIPQHVALPLQINCLLKTYTLYYAMPLEDWRNPSNFINIDTHIRTHACTPRTQTHASWAQWCTHTVQRTRCNDMRTAGTMKSNAPSLIEKCK